MSFLLTNSSMPSGPSSRPTPERLVPPNGSSGPPPSGWLIHTMPTSSRSATSRASCLVAAEHRPAEPVGAAVGQLDGAVGVGHPVDHGRRAEQLLAERPHLRRDPGQDGRLDERAGPVDPVAAGVHDRALADRVVDLLHQDLRRALGGQRPVVHAGVGRVTGDLRGHRLGELPDELVVDAVGDDHPLGRVARLAARSPSGPPRRPAPPSAGRCCPAR